MWVINRIFRSFFGKHDYTGKFLLFYWWVLKWIVFVDQFHCLVLAILSLLAELRAVERPGSFSD